MNFEQKPPNLAVYLQTRHCKYTKDPSIEEVQLNLFERIVNNQFVSEKEKDTKIRVSFAFKDSIHQVAPKKLEIIRHDGESLLRETGIGYSCRFNVLTCMHIVTAWNMEKQTHQKNDYFGQ